MRLRNETGDIDLERAVEGDDRPEILPGDMEALGGADDETLELLNLREMLADAVDASAQRRALEYTAVFQEAGLRNVDDNDEPRVEDLSREGVFTLLRYFAREQPEVLTEIADRHPAMTDLLTDLAVHNGAGR
jgi:hypothetical protein